MSDVFFSSLLANPENDNFIRNDRWSRNQLAAPIEMSNQTNNKKSSS